MSNTKKHLFLLAAMGSMFEQPGWAQGKGRNDYVPTNTIPEKPIPKGCKEYFFDLNGRFTTDRMRKGECVFICAASNDKNAKRKFNAWKESNRPNAI